MLSSRLITLTLQKVQTKHPYDFESLHLNLRRAERWVAVITSSSTSIILPHDLWLAFEAPERRSNIWPCMISMRKLVLFHIAWILFISFFAVYWVAVKTDSDEISIILSTVTVWKESVAISFSTSIDESTRSVYFISHILWIQNAK